MNSGFETTLSSLAMLKVKVSSGGDYLDYLRPFVNRVLSKWDESPITDSAVARGIADHCGLVIPDRTVQLVLRRLVRGGALEGTRVYI